jgi:hypothetical protein
MNNSLIDWFINYTKDFENNIKKDDYIHNDNIDEHEEMSGCDELTKSKDHNKSENTYVANILSYEFKNNKAYNHSDYNKALNFIKTIVNHCKTNKLKCFNCNADYFNFRTGKYGDFIYCKSCKCSLSESSFLKRNSNR